MAWIKGRAALRRVLCGFASLAGAVAVPTTARAVPALPDVVDFNRDIRPVLAENCFACHGFDENKRKGDLRLDTQAGAFAVIEGRHTIVPGKPAESEVVKRITHADADELMPPAESNKKLTEREVGLIKKWVEQGAEWKGHWAYLKPARPPEPAVADAAFVKNPIDKLVLAKLKEQELRPSPEADRVTLVRRLSFDLTGLPPKLAEVDAFVNDNSPGAYEKLVDQFLASPAYGERMAMYWLDMVRYADSIGYHSDNPTPVSPYRDYVIKSFNENKRFDQFTIEQIAGDLLPEATLQQKVASAYNKLLQTTQEGGAQAKEYEAKYAADRVRNASTVWLGQTMGCAECHDHKFDPITQKDFYTFAAFFADIQEPAVGDRGPGVPVLAEDQQQEAKKLDELIVELRKKLDTPTPQLAAAQADWERQQGGVASWVVLDPESLAAAAGTTLTEQPDHAVKAGGSIPPKETYTVTAKTNLQGITGVRLEALPDPAFAAAGPGASNNGNFVLTEFKVAAGQTGEAAKPVALHKPSADFSQEGWAVAGAIDGDNNTGWAVMPAFGAPHAAIFETVAPLGAGGETVLTFTLDHQQIYPQHNIGKFRLSVTTSASPAGIQAIPANVQAALAVAPEQRNDPQKNELAAYYRGIAPSLQPVREEIAAAEKRKSETLASVPTVLTSMSGPPRTTRLLARGNWLDESGAIVEPAVPAYLGSIDTGNKRGTRLDLARWLVSRDNPLTGRVFVNRLWKLAFGQGISKKLDDLGVQGDWPTHPELLDWLSTEFVDSGWDVKHVVRLIVTSGTYRQSSNVDPAMKERDPFNTLLARQGRFRLDAEIVRDNALAVSGLLVQKVGGKSAFPYQPPGYWYALNFPTREWQNDAGDNLYRRGLYTHWQRSFLHPSLLAFDAPSREECTVDRPRSNIPQQALVLLNDPTYVEAARVFAERIVREGGADAKARLNFAFKAALSRQPHAQEVQVLGELLAKHGQEYATDKEAAKKLLSAGAKPLPTDLDAGELAAWTSVARVILNLHETITRY